MRKMIIFKRFSLSNPKAVFPGISDEHIELLDHCVGKLQQRTGKVDVTWEELAKYEEMGMTM